MHHGATGVAGEEGCRVVKHTVTERVELQRTWHTCDRPACKRKLLDGAKPTVCGVCGIDLCDYCYQVYNLPGDLLLSICTDCAKHLAEFSRRWEAEWAIYQNLVLRLKQLWAQKAKEQ